MLFNSYLFILIFLPVTLLLFHGLRLAGRIRGALFVLTVMSLLFYGWWNPVYLLLLVPLTLANFIIARRILPQDGRCPPFAKSLLIIGIAGNLSVLGYFKYANFFVDNLNTLFGNDLHLARTILPLGISFFTFQKIAFLVDVYQGKVERLNLLDFSLFVSFFPQLIAGPIVHHSEVMSQFRRIGAAARDWAAPGLTLFALGLAKKVLLADTAALYATPTFDAAAAGQPLDSIMAWSAALAYTAQLYFDFSGYSDMAIGAALLFGIRLPVNFASPYQSASIIEFWCRWHITLSRFLRDYLYIPLGGSHKGQVRRYLNLFSVMFLGGLWHGAGWTFVVWGGLHGLYLVINHAWQAARTKLLPERALPGALGRRLAQILTFLAVVVGWVFFRSADLSTAATLLRAMIGLNGSLRSGGPAVDGAALLTVSLLFAIAWFAPNSQALIGYTGPGYAYTHPGTRVEEASSESEGGYREWRPSLRWAVAAGVLLAVCLMSMTRVSEFLYFQF